MILFEGGRIYISKGEVVPYTCPICGTLIPFVEGLSMVKCTGCRFEGEPEDFSKEYALVPVN